MKKEEVIVVDVDRVIELVTLPMVMLYKGIWPIELDRPATIDGVEYDWKCCSPLHKEKNPSFYFNVTTSEWYDACSGKTGASILYLFMDMYELDREDAARFLWTISELIQSSLRHTADGVFNSIMEQVNAK